MLRQGPPRSPANWPEFERALRALSVGTLAAAPPPTAHPVRRSNLPILTGSPDVGARRLKPQATSTKPLSGLGPGGGPPSEPPAPGLHQAGWRLRLSLPKPPLAHTLETAPKPARAAQPIRAPCKLLDSEEIFTVQKLAPHPQPARFIALQPAVSKDQCPPTWPSWPGCRATGSWPCALRSASASDLALEVGFGVWARRLRRSGCDRLRRRRRTPPSGSASRARAEQLPRGNRSRLVEPLSEPGGLPKCCAAGLAAAPPGAPPIPSVSLTCQSSEARLTWVPGG
jgi:hypothetical protein